MLALASILLGGIFPVVVAFWLGSLFLRSLPSLRGAEAALTAFALGAVVESTVVFFLLAAGAAKVTVLVLAGLASLCWFYRLHLPLPRPFVPGFVITAVFAVYGFIYLIYALAPETEPDGVTYHLGLVREYARRGSFSPHVTFFAMLPQGLEMLFLPAFLIGKHSAAKLVHFAFLIATPPLMVVLGRRLELPAEISLAAAAFYVCAPVVGLSGTSSYNDAALVFFVLITTLLLVIWKHDPANQDATRCLIAAGVAAGFCGAIKLNGLLVPSLAFAYAAVSARRLRPILLFSAAAALPVAPWVLRNFIATGDPLSPLCNGWFPNPYFHVEMERNLKDVWTGGVPLSAAPWQLVAGGRLHGVVGLFYLLLPAGLLALRHPAGRRCWIAAPLLAAAWLPNHGARFLMPALPFFAATLAIAVGLYLPRPVLPACVLLHAVLCWPALTRLYQAPDTWRWRAFPLRAALRIEPEDAYLRRTLGDMAIVDMLEQYTGPDDRIFSLSGVATAYTDREVLVFWESAEADRVLDALRLASVYANVPVYDLDASWPEQSFKGLRVRINRADPAEWAVSEVRLYLDGERVYSSPQWEVDAWPNPWEAPLAFDGNLASRWRTWEPRRSGMFFEVIFDHPQRLTAAKLVSHVPASSAPMEFYGLGLDGRWRLLSDRPVTRPRPKQNLRRAAIHFLQRNRIDYILAGRNLIKSAQEWGLDEVDERGSMQLLRPVKR